MVLLKKHGEKEDAFQLVLNPSQLWKVITIIIGFIGFIIQMEYVIITYSIRIDNNEKEIKEEKLNNAADHNCFKNALISHGINPYNYQMGKRNQ